MVKTPKVSYPLYLALSVHFSTIRQTQLSSVTQLRASLNDPLDYFWVTRSVFSDQGPGVTLCENESSWKA